MIIASRDGNVLGMCKETGIIREGKTLNEVGKKLIKSTTLLIDTVLKNPAYLPSLKVGLPFKYQMLYYFTLLKMFFHRFGKNVGELEFFTRKGSTLIPQYG